MGDSERAIAEVFKSFVVPGLSIDLHQSGFRCRASLLTKSWEMTVPLGTESSRDFAKVIALKRLLKSADPNSFLVELFSQAPVIATGFRRSKELLQARSSVNSNQIHIQARDLMWSGSVAWVPGYSRYVEQILRIVLFNEERIRVLIEGNKKRLNAVGLDDGNLDVVDQFSRVMPTKLHYAAASLGAWVGGAINLQFLAHYATEPQLLRPQRNRDYAERIGYSKEEAKALDEGGLVSVPADVLSLVCYAQESMQVVGGISLDEINPVNPPTGGLMESVTATDMPGILLDKYYRAPFRARNLRNQAVYGSRNVYRDHYTAFYSDREAIDVLRCKHYCAPVYQVGSLSEIEALAAAIPNRSEEGIVYRGQTELFLLNRPRPVKQFLFGESCAKEPSFGTSAARRNFDYDSLHFGIGYYLENYGLDFPRVQGEMGAQVFRDWREARTSSECGVDYAIMALAQHYGLPSHGLDVTTSLEVASWFATHLYETAPDGQVSYRRMKPEDWPKDPERWPVVAVFQPVTWSLAGSLQDCQELEAFGMKALRPVRQSAKFFLGGHSDHQNRLAEAAVCFVRLKPGIYGGDLTFGNLFPSAGEDAAFRMMLKLADFKPLRELGANGVARYKYWTDLQPN